MKIQYTFKGMRHWEEVRMKEYTEVKERALEKLLTHFPDDTVHLGVRAERFEKNNAYEVELTMEIPGKLFVGKEASHTIEKALDLSKDRLVAQLRKHEDLLKSRGKSASGLKRFIKEISEERVAGGLTEATYDSALSSELGSNPIHTL